MKTPGYFNRSFNPFTVVSEGDQDDVLRELYELGKSMSMPRSTWGESGDIDLKDREKWDNGTGQSPYDRWMELLDKPKYGGRSVREEMTDLVRSDSWEMLDDGTETYPGGARHMLAQKVLRSRLEVAKQTMLEEYPKLMEAVQRDKIKAAEALFGIE